MRRMTPLSVRHSISSTTATFDASILEGLGISQVELRRERVGLRSGSEWVEIWVEMWIDEVNVMLQAV